MAEDFDISKIDASTLRDRPSPLAHPVFGVLLVGALWVVATVSLLLPGPPRPVRALATLFILGVAIGIPLALYESWDLRKHRVEWALRCATKWGHSLFIGKPRLGRLLVYFVSIMALMVPPALLFPELGGRTSQAAAAGFILPAIFLAPRLRPVYELSWEIIRQVKAQQ